MNLFVRFMVSPTGRIARLVAGAALILWGLLVIGGTVGIVVAAIGLVPLIAGMVDICVFAPLFNCPIRGQEIRVSK